MLKHVLNSHLRKFFCVGAFLLPSLCFGVGEGGVDDFGMEDHSQICNAKKNMQALSEPDFDGNGIVDEADLELVNAAVALANSTGKYTAFFDINNDSKLNNHDIEKTKVSAKLGKVSTSLDVQVAELYHAAKKYEDISVALKDGYIPFTQEYQNHGIHMIRFLPGEDNVLDEEFNHAAIEWRIYWKGLGR